MISGYTPEVQLQRAFVVPLETKFTSVRAPQAGHTLVRATVIPPTIGFSVSNLVQPLVSEGLPKAVSVLLIRDTSSFTW